MRKIPFIFLSDCKEIKKLFKINSLKIIDSFVSIPHQMGVGEAPQLIIRQETKRKITRCANQIFQNWKTKERHMTFRTIDTDMASVGAATESDITRTSAARRARSARRAAIRGSRMSSRVWIYSKI
jgi:hypothetical protein